MRFGPGLDASQQKLNSVFRLDSFEVGAVLAQITKQGAFIGLNSLPYDRDSQPAHDNWI